MSDAPPKKRTGTLGCFGFFCLLCLLVFSAGNVAALEWLRPAWLDRIAWWKGARVEPDITLLTGTSSVLHEPAPFSAVSYPLAPILDPFSETSATYEPAKGAVVQLASGPVVEFPPGSMRTKSEIHVSNVVQVPQAKSGPFAGPVLDVKIGALEHMRFETPITVTAPFEPGTKNPSVAVWEDGKGWVSVPSEVDASRGVVRAQVPHASLIAIVGLVAVGSIPFLTATGRSGTANLIRWGSVYDTPNFAIHFYTTGKHAVPDDKVYAPGRGVNDAAPFFVRDYGAYLEQGRDLLGNIGIKIDKAHLFRHQVFLEDLGGDAGVTPTGGPMYLTTTLPQAGIDVAMRSTATHELVHIAQQNYIIPGTGLWQEAWIESTGAYVGDVAWDKAGEPTNIVRDFYLNDGDLLTRSFPTTRNPDHYAYGTFFRHMDRRTPGADAGFELVKAMFASKSSSLSAMDALVKERPNLYDKRDLAGLFTDFAKDFDHDDFWSGELFPRRHRGSLTAAITDQSAFPAGNSAKETFAVVSSPTGGELQQVNLAAKASLASAAPLTAHASYFWISPLPKPRKAKLAIAVDPAPRSKMRMYVAKDHLVAAAVPRLPLAGTPGHFEDVLLPAPWRVLIDDIGKQTNLVTLLGVNESLDTVSSGYTVHRWLLLAPSWVKFSPKEGRPGAWEITWEEAELKNERSGGEIGGRPYFRGYALYRKHPGDASFTRVTREIQQEHYVDEPPAGAWVYTVRVEDVLGFESADADAAADPFVGTWEGEFQLVEGSLVQTIDEWMQKTKAESGAKKRASIARLPEDERGPALARFEKELKAAEDLWAEVKKVLDNAEEIARLGVPITLEIEDGGGDTYQVRMTEIVWKTLERGKGTEFTRKGAATLEMSEGLDMGGDATAEKAKAAFARMFPPIKLKLCHANPATGRFEIREDGYVMSPEIDGKVARCKIKWSLDKKVVPGT